VRIETLPLNDTNLANYSTIPISFEVRSRLNIELLDNGFGGMIFREEKVTPTYIKEYDPFEPPTMWPKRFNVAKWAIFLARDGAMPVGGITVAFRTAGVDMLERREDLAVVWDIRVRPEYRRSGIGTKLFAEAVEWSKKSGCTQLKVETQNIDVPACRFYIKQGCQLGEIHRYKYVRHPATAHEVMLVWYLDLAN
jgi:ribosomal protein S18 acetylase RimI-like enzyme